MKEYNSAPVCGRVQRAKELFPTLGSLNELVLILRNSMYKKAQACSPGFGSLSNIYAFSNWEFGDVYWVSNLWIISHDIQRASSLWFWRSLESSVAYYNIFAHFVNSGKSKSSKLQPQVLWHTRLLRMSN